MKMKKSSATFAALLLASSFVAGHAYASTASLTTGAHPNLLPTCGEGGDPNPSPFFVMKRSGNVQGRTPTEIHANFASVVESNFANGSASLVLSRLTDKELENIARIYYQSNAGRSSQLLNVFASRLTAKELVRVAGAFGTANVTAAVKQSASPNVASMYAARVAMGEVKTAFVASPMAGPAPTRYMTLEEIYLEFRTAPVGSLGAGAAFSETVIFAGAQVGAAAGIGWEIGTQISDLITKYDPALSDAIGGTVAGVVDRVQNAANAIENSAGTQRGIQEHNADQMFNYPVSSSSDPYGDWDSTWDMGNDASDGCF